MLCFTQPASGSGGCGCPSRPWRRVPASRGAEVSRSLTPCHADWDLLTKPHIYWFGWCRWAAAVRGVQCWSSIGTDLTPNLPPPPRPYRPQGGVSLHTSLCLSPPRSVSPGIYPKFPSLQFTPTVSFPYPAGPEAGSVPPLSFCPLGTRQRFFPQSCLY